jgi:uncharacterized Zn finger protein (UPF0148 family)
MSKEKIVEELGVRLLRGETMLADSCPSGCNCPLMKGRNAIECVSCRRRFKRNEDGDLVEEAREDSPAVVAATAPAVQAVKEAPQKPAEPRRIADVPGVGKVGQRLLEGWTMTADHCPVCFSPIMRSPIDKTLWCAQCNVQAVTEAEYDKTKHRLVNEPEPVAAAPREEPVPVAQARPQPAPRPVEESQDERAVLENVKRTLLTRLQRSQVELQRLKIEHTHEADKLLDHIAKLLNTLHELKAHQQ